MCTHIKYTSTDILNLLTSLIITITRICEAFEQLQALAFFVRLCHGTSDASPVDKLDGGKQ